jgi:S-adenosylmethionine synthetase
MNTTKIITSEYVSYGHPDKVADQISDALLDLYLSKDANTRAGIETMVKDNIVILGGEVKTNAIVDVEGDVRRVMDNVKYPDNHHLHGDDIKIINLIGKQSSEISNGVDKCGTDVIGAGDQGFVVGFASNETKEYLPLGTYIARQICNGVTMIDGLGPDVKTQVCIEYGGRKPKVKSIIVSTLHSEDITVEAVRDMVKNAIITNRVDLTDVMDNEIHFEFIKDKDIEYYINVNGSWNIGGPISDCGLTGRKIVVDQYGGYCNVGGGSFCVDGETEYIGEDLKWHKIKDYVGGKVGQWNNGILEFVMPSKYHVSDSEKMYHFHSQTSIDMVLSENHSMVAKTSKGNIYKVKVKDVINKINHNVSGFKDNIPCTFEYYPDSDGINLTDDQIRLQVAFCVEGTYSSISEDKGRINIKKKKKIERLEWLLKKTNTDYRLVDKGEYQNHYYYFIPPVPNNKSLYSIFKNASYKQLAIVAKEILKWDGDETNGIFRTTIKEDADFAQFVFCLIYGKRSHINKDERIWRKKELNGKEYTTKSICYSVTIGKTSEISFGGIKSKIEIDNFKCEKMYCFTVPSGMLLLRRSDKIFVTGNCGKDMSKVDRSAAYMARYIAKNIVDAELADSAKVEISYIISNPNPCAIKVELKNPVETTLNDLSTQIEKYVKERIDLTPNGIIKRFFPCGIKPIFYNVARNGHFGFNNIDEWYPWEKTDFSNDLREYIEESEINLM